MDPYQTALQHTDGFALRQPGGERVLSIPGTRRSVTACSAVVRGAVASVCHTAFRYRRCSLPGVAHARRESALKAEARHGQVPAQFTCRQTIRDLRKPFEHDQETGEVRRPRHALLSMARLVRPGNGGEFLADAKAACDEGRSAPILR